MFNICFFLFLPDCFNDELARDYRGYASKTKSGKRCQPWTAQEPHQHNRTQDKYPSTGLGQHNFCRNPDNEPEGAWCYTTDSESRWEYCEIGVLSEEPCASSVLGKLNFYWKQYRCSPSWESKLKMSGGGKSSSFSSKLLRNQNWNTSIGQFLVDGVFGWQTSPRSRFVSAVVVFGISSDVVFIPCMSFS